MRGEELEDVRSLSVRVFGHRYRLELLVALAQAPDGRVNLGMLADSRGVTAAVYYPPIQDLMASGLVTRVEGVSVGRRRWYQRAGGDQVWESMGRLTDELGRHFDTIVGAGSAGGDGQEMVGA